MFFDYIVVKHYFLKAIIYFIFHCYLFFYEWHSDKRFQDYVRMCSVLAIQHFFLHSRSEIKKLNNVSAITVSHCVNVCWKALNTYLHICIVRKYIVPKILNRMFWGFEISISIVSICFHAREIWWWTFLTVLLIKCYSFGWRFSYLSCFRALRQRSTYI